MEMIPKTKSARPRSPVLEQQEEQKRLKAEPAPGSTHTLGEYAISRKQGEPAPEKEIPNTEEESQEIPNTKEESQEISNTKEEVGEAGFDFYGISIEPTNEEAFTDAVARIQGYPRPERLLAALHEELKKREKEEGQFKDAREYVEYVMQVDTGIPMHAPPQLGISDFQELFEDLWQATVTSQVEQGGIITHEIGKENVAFRPGTAGTGAHFTANTQDWDRKTEQLRGVVHTHPQGTSFSPGDLEGQLSGGAHVEYIRTASQIFALMRTGDFENRFRHLVGELGSGEKVVEKMREDFDKNYSAALDKLIDQKQGEEPLEGEDREKFITECDQLASREAVKAYANWIHAGYYEGEATDQYLLKQSDH